MAMPASHLDRNADDGIERQDVLDVVGSRLQQAIGSAFAAGGTVGRRIRDFLHGTWLGHPLHPALIDVPLGAWTTAFVLDTIGADRRGFARAADSAIALGLAGGAAAAVTGLTDWHHTEGADRRRGLTHGLLNLGAMTIYATALTLRRRGARNPGRLLAALGLLTAGTAAYLGGDLVYRRRIGVDHGARPGGWDSFVAVLPERELQEGWPRRVEARGVSIVLVRRGGRVYALGEACAHLGGPLSEGRVDGDAIRCPWHGSLFALDDGRVLEGPSAYPQPCFDVRVRGESIEVRARG